MNDDLLVPVLRKFSKWSLIASVLIFVCGILAIILPIAFAVGVAVTIGSLVLVAGIAHLVFAFQTRNAGGFLWQILVSALYEMAAVCLLANPLSSLLSLTLFLAVFLLVEGIFELVLYFRLRRFHHAVWVLIDGVGTLALGLLMVKQWPPASPEIIGTLVGLSLTLSAVSRVALSLAVRAFSPIAAALAKAGAPEQNHLEPS